MHKNTHFGSGIRWRYDGQKDHGIEYGLFCSTADWVVVYASAKFGIKGFELVIVDRIGDSKVLSLQKSYRTVRRNECWWQMLYVSRSNHAGHYLTTVRQTCTPTLELKRSFIHSIFLESMRWQMALPNTTNGLTSWSYDHYQTKCYQTKLFEKKLTPLLPLHPATLRSTLLSTTGLTGITKRIFRDSLPTLLTKKSAKSLTCSNASKHEETKLRHPTNVHRRTLPLPPNPCKLLPQITTTMIRLLLQSKFFHSCCSTPFGHSCAIQATFLAPILFYYNRKFYYCFPTPQRF
jgi:hypothetical protein